MPDQTQARTAVRPHKLGIQLEEPMCPGRQRRKFGKYGLSLNIAGEQNMQRFWAMGAAYQLGFDICRATNACHKVDVAGVRFARCAECHPEIFHMRHHAGGWCYNDVAKWQERIQRGLLRAG